MAVEKTKRGIRPNNEIRCSSRWERTPLQGSNLVQEVFEHRFKSIALRVHFSRDRQPKNPSDILHSDLHNDVVCPAPGVIEVNSNLPRALAASNPPLAAYDCYHHAVC